MHRPGGLLKQWFSVACRRSVMSGPREQQRLSQPVHGSNMRRAEQAGGSRRPEDGGGRTEEATAAACRVESCTPGVVAQA